MQPENWEPCGMTAPFAWIGKKLRLFHDKMKDPQIEIVCQCSCLCVHFFIAYYTDDVSPNRLYKYTITPMIGLLDHKPFSIAQFPGSLEPES